jgi:hypothetical protein
MMHCPRPMAGGSAATEPDDIVACFAYNGRLNDDLK